MRELIDYRNKDEIEYMLTCKFLTQLKSQPNSQFGHV